MLPFYITGLVGLLSAGLSSASPTRVINPHLLIPLNEVAVRDPLEVARDPEIEKRISADFSLNHEWHNEVLFDGQWSNVGEHGAEAVSLSVVCRECWTKGDVKARITTRDIIKPVVRLELGGVQAYVDLQVGVSASAVYAINLFTSNSPVGIGFPGLSIGLVFYVDLVFSASAVLDLEGGFYVTLEEDAFLEADIFKGDVTDSLFDGIGTKTFPITVHTGKATFKAALRLRTQLGVETQIPFTGISIGGGAVVGIYANILEFIAELESTPTCALETRQSFNMNVGAYARAGFDLDFTTIGVAPTVSTTLFDSPTWTQCWIEGQPVNSGLGRIDAGATQSVSAVTSPAALLPTLSAPTLPAFAEPVPTKGDSGSLVVVTTITPAGEIALVTTIAPAGETSLVTQPRPTIAPSPPLGRPQGNSTITPVQQDLITTTVYQTTEYIITSCAADVINCPGSLEKKIVVTKTLDAFTTVCPPGASITVPPQREPVTIDAADKPVIHVITEVTHLHKLKTPVVNTFHESATRKPVSNQVTIAEVASASSPVPSATTVDQVVSVKPVVSELPVAIQADSLPSHNATTTHVSEGTEGTVPPPASTNVPTAAGSKYQSFGSLHIFAAVLVVVGLA